MSRIRASNTCSPCLLRTRTGRLLKALSERLSFLHPENTYDIFMYILIYTNKSFILVFHIQFTTYLSTWLCRQILFIIFLVLRVCKWLPLYKGRPPAECRCSEVRPENCQTFFRLNQYKRKTTSSNEKSFCAYIYIQYAVGKMHRPRAPQASPPTLSNKLITISLSTIFIWSGYIYDSNASSEYSKSTGMFQSVLSSPKRTTFFFLIPNPFRL